MGSAIVLGLLALFMVTAADHCNGQVVRLGPRPTPHAGLDGLGSITILASPSSVNFTLAAGGQANASSGVTITTVLSVSLSSTVTLYGYFASTSALTDSYGDSLPSAAVFGRCTTGAPTSFTAFTQTGPFSTGSSLLIYQQNNFIIGEPRSDTLSLLIDLSHTAALPAGSYNGTLVLQAQAM